MSHNKVPLGEMMINIKKEEESRQLIPTNNSGDAQQTGEYPGKTISKETNGEIQRSSSQKPALSKLVSDTTALSILLEEILVSLLVSAETSPSLYLDLEGANLSRDGRISLMTIHMEPSTTAILDIASLQDKAFTSPCTKSLSVNLKMILESTQITKIFFDVRNDSEALFKHFGIALKGVLDLQLMENASRHSNVSKKFLNGLKNCIQCDMEPGQRERDTWVAAKTKGEKLWNPDKGGSYPVFDARPLHKDVAEYCIQEVMLLPELRNLYWSKMRNEWEEMVAVESMNRVKESQIPKHDLEDPDRKLGPWQMTGPKVSSPGSDDLFSFEDEDDPYDDCW